MPHKNVTTIGLTGNTVYDPMSVGNTDTIFILTRTPIETPKPSSKTDYYTSSSSIYTPINASTSTLSPSAVLPAVLTLSFKIHKKIQ